MNAVEIEEAISNLADSEFDPVEFPYAFLEAFGNKKTTINRLKSTTKSSTNKSDVGGVLQRNNIHILVCPEGEVTEALTQLRESPATTKQKAKYILATDGKSFEAENLVDGETISCDYPDFHNHFGFFLPLAGITTVKQIRENAFDIKATGRLNKLYVELLKHNPDWDTDDRRVDLNHFFARLIFCYFAEDTNIFHSTGLFTATIEQMSDRDGSNMDFVIGKIFQAMNMKNDDHKTNSLPSWANIFPYVNGNLFGNSSEGDHSYTDDVPKFSKIARSYLIHIGNLDWTKINPDIFGSMIQAVADDDERGAIGMHYTSVPNILKVLNPLFLEELREKLEEAGDGSSQGSLRKLLNLRDRMKRIRVFDPACGSGNFLVIAYKEMREIEAEINKRRNEDDRASEIPLTNFRGIEIRSFSCEIARLALIIAEYQCDVLYRGQKLALAEFLPLDAKNWITCGNALRLDWVKICSPTGIGVKVEADNDLFGSPTNQTEMDFENEGGETYICGNPPYLGSTWQSSEQKADLMDIFQNHTKSWKSLDYVAGWFMKAAIYGVSTDSAAAFVSTNSICQGQQVPILWPLILKTGHEIHFAHTSFRWANLASHNAGVTVAIIGISNKAGTIRVLYSLDGNKTVAKVAGNINCYLASAKNVIVEKRSQLLSDLNEMTFGSKPVDDGNLFLNHQEKSNWILEDSNVKKYIHPYSNSEEFINGKSRFCLWIDSSSYQEAVSHKPILLRLKNVSDFRAKSKKKQTVELSATPYRFAEIRHIQSDSITVIPRVSSENRNFLPVGFIKGGTVIGDRNFAIYDAPLWNMALIASRLHWVWIATVCVRLEMRFSYSNTLGWNTFPVPILTQQNKDDLTKCAEEILLAREQYFPATIADMYDPKRMDEEFPLVREVHERNDEILERIYIGRRFKNDTERLEKLFDMYTKMVEKKNSQSTTTNKKSKR